MTAMIDRDAKTEWLKSLKAGDEVVLIPSGYYDKPQLAKVDRRTPAGWLIVGTQTFGTDGRGRTNDTYTGRARLEMPTPQLRDKVERFALVEMLKTVKWETTSLDTLRATVAAYQQAIGAPAPKPAGSVPGDAGTPNSKTGILP